MMVIGFEDADSRAWEPRDISPLAPPKPVSMSVTTRGYFRIALGKNVVLRMVMGLLRMDLKQGRWKGYSTGTYCLRTPILVRWRPSPWPGSPRQWQTGPLFRVLRLARDRTMGIPLCCHDAMRGEQKANKAGE
jgi:hypothetical protein